MSIWVVWNCPRLVNELATFENDLIKLTENDLIKLISEKLEVTFIKAVKHQIPGWDLPVQSLICTNLQQTPAKLSSVKKLIKKINVEVVKATSLTNEWRSTEKELFNRS